MKILFVALTTLILAGSALASDIEAIYVVPVPQELAPFSRFAVKVSEPYAGDTTDTLAYTFPEELTGAPALSVVLKRTPGTPNDWESPMMKASCAEVDSVFTCNMYLTKNANNTLVAPLSVAGAANVLSMKNLAPMDLVKQLLVVEKFLSSEPAGILTYKFSK